MLSFKLFNKFHAHERTPTAIHVKGIWELGSGSSNTSHFSNFNDNKKVTKPLAAHLPESDPAAGEDGLALGAFRGDLVLEALDAVDVLVVRDDERLAPHLPTHENFAKDISNFFISQIRES